MAGELDRLLDLSRRRDRIFDDAIDEYVNELRRIQGEVERQVLRYISSLEAKGNTFNIDSQLNFDIALNSNQVIRDAFVEAGFPQSITNLLDKYDDILDVVQDEYRLQRLPIEFKDADITAITAIKEVDFRQFAQAGDVLSDTLSKRITEAVFMGQTRDQLAASVASALQGAPGAESQLVNFSKTYANTALHGFDQAVTAQKAEEAEIDQFVYLGPSDALTRDFCSQYVGEVLSRKEIEQLSNGQGLDVFTFGGGYNCRHKWAPVSDTVAKSKQIRDFKERSQGS